MLKNIREYGFAKCEEVGVLSGDETLGAKKVFCLFRSGIGLNTASGIGLNTKRPFRGHAFSGIGLNTTRPPREHESSEKAFPGDTLPRYL